jgi:anti-anti-sigma factor
MKIVIGTIVGLNNQNEYYNHKVKTVKEGIMEDFEQKVVDDVVVEVVNLTRATWKEANQFKLILQADIEKKFRKLVVDISKIEFMDSTFLGTLVLTKRNITQIGGDLKLVEPLSVFKALMEKTSTLNIFESYKSASEAVKSFKHAEPIKPSVPLHV